MRVHKECARLGRDLYGEGATVRAKMCQREGWGARLRHAGADVVTVSRQQTKRGALTVLMSALLAMHDSRGLEDE